MKTATGNSGKRQKERCPSSRCIFLLGLLGVLFFFPLRALSQTVEESEKYENSIQPPDKVMDAVGLKPGMVIGEVGAGRGRYTVHLAQRVGDKGRVYANDINQAGLDHLRERCQHDGIKNVEIILGKEDDPLLPKDMLDMVFIVMTYHHLSKPIALLKNLIPSLKPKATVVIIERDPVKAPRGWMASETTSPEKMRHEAAEAGFEIARTETFLTLDNIFILQMRLLSTGSAA
jgi:precorrin-6B methylase 2